MRLFLNSRAKIFPVGFRGVTKSRNETLHSAFRACHVRREFKSCVCIKINVNICTFILQLRLNRNIHLSVKTNGV